MCKQKESPHSKLSLAPVWVHHMEPYHIEHQHQETANHLKHSFANRYWLHTRYKHSTPTRRNQSLINGYPSQASCHST